MGEISKTVGQWAVTHLGWTVIIVLFILSSIFKIAKKEIDPLGWVIGFIGKAFTKDVRNDVAKLQTETTTKFEELKSDTNIRISDLRADLDSFESRTNTSIDEMKSGTHDNCLSLKLRLDQMEKSNDMQTIRQIKAHVLDFANSCLNQRRHTKRDFDNIIKENEEYEALCRKYELKNDVYTEDFNYIMKIYHRCQDNNSFLRDEELGDVYEQQTSRPA